jgi:hypothetical protein
MNSLEFYFAAISPMYQNSSVVLAPDTASERSHPTLNTSIPSYEA